MVRKPRLLWVSDAACPTGFATVTHNVLGWLGSAWERLVLGINATGDPYPAPFVNAKGELVTPAPLPFPVFPSRVGGDVWGFGRFKTVVEKYQPDVVVIQSDSWIINGFLEVARKIKNCPPLVGYMPIDGQGMKRATALALNDLALAVFYTQFGVEQAKAAGVTCPTSAIGLGVRREVFSPMPQAEARRGLGLEVPEGAFVFGNVNRNQPRKRLDLTIAWFAEFLKDADAGEHLYLHCLAEDVGWDLNELAHFYGIADRVHISSAATAEELVDERRMRLVYNSLDVQISTTMGEGWGLPTLEGMACGVPQIVPDWAALGEWPRGAVRYVGVEPGVANFGFAAFGIGSTPDKREFIEAMHELRDSAKARAAYAKVALAKASEPRFDWSFAAKCFHEDLTAVLEETKTAAA